MQVKLTVCLVLNNEEDFIFRCLSSIKDVADEIIIVDTGSTDKTIDIARNLSESIYNYQGNTFNTAWNYALEKASGSWVLMMNGNEELDVKSKKYLLEKINTGKSEAYYVKIINHNEEEKVSLANTFLCLRLFKNRKEYRYSNLIHKEILDSILLYNPSAVVNKAENVCIINYYLNDNNKEKLERKIEIFSKNITDDIPLPLKNFYMGIEYQKHRELKKAIEIFLSLYNDNTLTDIHKEELMYFIVVSYFMLDNLKEALEFINKYWSKTSPLSAEMYYIKGIICMDLGQYSDSYEAFNQFLELPDFVPNRSSILYLQRDKVFYFLGRLAEYFIYNEQALYYYLESLKNNPHLFSSFARMISILDPGVNPEYTMESLNTVFDLSDHSIQYDMAEAFYKEGAYSLSLDCIAELEKNNLFSENIRLLKGMCLLRKHLYTEAEENLKHIEKDKNLFIKARQTLLLYYWLQQDFRKVAGSLKRLKNTEASPYLLNILGRFSRNNSSFYELKENTSTEEYLIITEIMDLLVEIGDDSQINSAWQNIAPFAGKRPSRLLAKLFYKHKKYEQAEKEWQSLMQEDSKDAEAMYYFGKSCWAQKNLNKAVWYLNEAIMNGLDTPTTRQEMTRLYQVLTINTIQESLKLYPDNNELSNLLKKQESLLLEI